MKYLRRACWMIGLVVVLLVGFTPILAQAHILREDNGIEAELHIPPNDMPIAQQSTKLEFSFGSSQGTFNLQHCDCQAFAAKGQLKTNADHLQATPADATVSAITYVYFPEAGDYNIVLTGTATDGSFNSFKLTYPAHVAKPLAKPRSATSGIAIIAVTTLAVLGLIGYSLIKSRR